MHLFGHDPGVLWKPDGSRDFLIKMPLSTWRTNPSFDAAIEKIKELDQNDEKYLEMLNQPVLVDPTYPERLEKELGEFICHIFDQPVERAYRRSRVYLPKRVNDRLARAVDGETLTMKNLMTRMAEKIKQKSNQVIFHPFLET